MSAGGEAGRVLICAPNWLGDGIMSMPAVQRFKAARPGVRLTVLVKERLCDLWGMHPAVDAVMGYRATLGGTVAAARAVRGGGYSACYVLPNSFRSAWIAWQGRVPVRRGFRGRHRAWLLNRIVNPDPALRTAHQSEEYRAILGVPAGERLPHPQLVPPGALPAHAAAAAAAGGEARPVVLLPGAAYGPSKRWPIECFGELGRRLRDDGLAVCICGSGNEREAGRELVRALGAEGVTDLTGRTTIPELAAVLKRAAAVVSNDSGGMHLAAAVGAPVAALFGITDPQRTGPLGPRVRVLCGQARRRSRDLPRESAEAEQALRSLTPETVHGAVRDLLAGGAGR